MKIILLTSLFCLKLFSFSPSDYASFYADTLIHEFDEALDLKVIKGDYASILESDIYFRILSARDYLENHEQTLSVKNSSLLEYKFQDYLKIKNIIDANAIKINKFHKELKRNNSILYPSITGHGNLTGNTFPKGTWSITFDDGPHPTRTKESVDNFYQVGEKATYFMLTENVKKYPSVLDYVLDSGMELALHSYTHRNLNSYDDNDDVLDYEITKAKKDLEQMSLNKIEIFRLPYGAGMRNNKVRKKIAQNNLIHIFWNVDTLDWKDKDPVSIVNRSLKQMMLTPQKSGIILFHDIHNQSIIASKMLLDHMLDDELKVCTIGEMIKYFNNKEQNCL